MSTGALGAGGLHHSTILSLLTMTGNLSQLAIRTAWLDAAPSPILSNGTAMRYQYGILKRLFQVILSPMPRAPLTSPSCEALCSTVTRIARLHERVRLHPQ